MSSPRSGSRPKREWGVQAAVTLLAAAAIVCVVGLAGGIILPPGGQSLLTHGWGVRPALLTVLSLTALLAGAWRARSIPAWIPVLAGLWIGFALVSDIANFVNGTIQSGARPILIGLLPGFCSLFLVAIAWLLRQPREWVEQLLLSLGSVVLFLSAASLLFSFTTPQVRPEIAILGASLPLGIALILLGFAALTIRRTLFPQGILAGDAAAWRVIHATLPVTIFIPFDRLVLILNRDRIDPKLYNQLDVIVAVINLLAIVFLFNWAIWRLARAYQSVRRSEARLALAVEAPGAGLFDWNVVTGDLMWTPDAERRIGMTIGSMNHIDLWRSLVRPEDVETINAEIAAVAARQGDHLTYRFGLHAANGALHTYEGSGRCFYDESGELVRLVGINLDVTEREAHEAALEERETQLRSIFQNVPDAMILVTEDGTIRNFSDAAERIFGCAERDVVGTNIAALVPTEGGFAARHLGETSGRHSEGPIILVAHRPDGTNFPAELTTANAQVRSAAIFIVFIRDISDRVEAERRLEDMRNDFAHGARLSAMGELAAGLAHELNQPLAASSNFLGAAEVILKRKEVDADLIEMIGQSRGQLLRAGEIIRRLRDFLAKGAAEMRVEGVDQMLHDAIALGVIGRQHHLVAVHHRVLPGAEFMLADRVQVQQVLVNLLRNAVEVMTSLPEGDRHIEVEAAPVNAEMLRITVTDTGPGFPEEILRQLFTPFLSSKGTDGLGIGLSICKRIVEAHGGEMTARNIPGSGASIAFTLPRPPQTAYGLAQVPNPTS